MQNIQLRAATLEDLSILYQFEQGIVSAERPFDTTLKSGHINYYNLQAYVEDSDIQVIVAEVDGELAGSGYVKINKAKSYHSYEYYAYVGFIYVAPSHRRKGISQLIIKELISWAKTKGLTEIKLDVYVENEIAVAAYEAIGFKKQLVEMRMEI